MALLKNPEDSTGRVVLLGYGTVARCALPMLIEQGVPAGRVLVLDAVDRRPDLAPWMALGLAFQIRRITRTNLARVLGEACAAGDLLLNLSVGIDSLDIADWCQQHGVLYVDTALEVWEDVIADFAALAPADRTEYALHQRARRLASGWPRNGPTAVVTHGANPGLVSHFAKSALEALAQALGLDREPMADRSAWARLARQTGTKVIHISERDTQISSRPKRPGEFVNTWSIPGFVEEAMMPGEVGWGSHEKRLPIGAHEHQAGPRNSIYFSRPSARLLLRSWVPLGGAIAGLALPHSESITLSDFLTDDQDGCPRYRPTVAFSYLACDAAMASLHECLMRDWVPQPAERIMNDDIVEGRDELGVLLLGNRQTGWWYGSQLDIHQARRLVPGSNPTAVQVAAGAVAAALWALANPERGYCEPEDLPHQEILSTALPYLGTIASQPTDWSPLEGRSRLFDEPDVDWKDPWQFGNFLIA